MAIIKSTCGFCGDEIERGTGKIRILREGKVLRLCGTKCEKNMFKLHRVARETPWTAEYKALKQMRMSTAAHHDKKEVKAEKVKEKSVVKVKEKAPAKHSEAKPAAK